MDKQTQKLIEHDAFTEGVVHSVDYVKGHRSQMKLYGGIAAGVLLLVGGVWFFMNRQHTTRQADLGAALRNKDAVVGPGTPNDPRPAYATKEEKAKAETKGFQDLIAKHGGTDEAAVAHYQLGVLAVDAGKLDEAATHFKAAADTAGKDIGSPAKLSLAQVYFNQNKASEAEAILRGLIASPTILVSKEQATMALARMLGTTKPEEARKLLEPIQKDTTRPTAQRNAEVLLGELPQPPKK